MIKLFEKSVVKIGDDSIFAKNISIVDPELRSRSTVDHIYRVGFSGASEWIVPKTKVLVSGLFGPISKAIDSVDKDHDKLLVKYCDEYKEHKIDYISTYYGNDIPIIELSISDNWNVELDSGLILS